LEKRKPQRPKPKEQQNRTPTVTSPPTKPTEVRTQQPPLRYKEQRQRQHQQQDHSTIIGFKKKQSLISLSKPEQQES